MSTEQLENRIIACLEGEMTKAERLELMDLIATDKASEALWQEYSTVYGLLGADNYEAPADDIQASFDSWLDKQTATSNDKNLWNKFKNIFIIVGIGTLVVGGWLISQKDKVCNEPMQFASNTFDSELLVNSPTERIKAIRVNHSQVTENKEVLDVLCQVLRTDNSSNVRLAAAESLGNYVYNERVRIELIQALGIENDGFVKLAIISALGNNLDAEVKKTFEGIVADDTQQKFVKDEVYLKLIQSDRSI